MAVVTPRNLAKRRIEARKRHYEKDRDERLSQREIPEQYRDRGTRIPTRDLKQNMELISAMLAMPSGSVGHVESIHARQAMERKFDWYSTLLQSRDARETEQKPKQGRIREDAERTVS